MHIIQASNSLRNLFDAIMVNSSFFNRTFLVSPKNSDDIIFDTLSGLFSGTTAWERKARGTLFDLQRKI